jgi:general secretion pathway protein B
MDAAHPADAAPPVYAPEIPPTQDYVHGAPRRSAHADSSSDAATHRAARAPDPVLTDGNPADSEVLPSINEINVADQPALANLHLDVHVYATQPSERFVYINMRKYREGATLAEGPVLERIRRDGVVLNYQGLRFVLPRQQ